MSQPRLTPGKLVLMVGVALAITLVVLVLAPLIGVSQHADGSRALSFIDLGAVLAHRAGDPSADIFWIERLPRVCAVGIAGAGLAVAGVSFQAVLRNPLAEPFTLGISQGATLGAVLAIRLGLRQRLGSSAVPMLAFAGALASVAVVWRLATVGRRLPAASLLLAGITLGVICAAATMLMQSTASFSDAYQIMLWMMGGFMGGSTQDMIIAGIAVALGLAILLWHARDLNALAAGGEAAASVGVAVDRATLLCHGAASLIVGAAIAVAGPIGFVGLIVPHAIRGIIGPDHRALLPVTALLGAAFVVACDTVARTVLAPNHQLPVGVITALLGGPFFLFLLRREKSRGRLWA
jgi:iron complex transport system permease protein